MRRTLLAVCGLTPQVVTETLFALHQQGRMVDAVRILTTRPGRELCLARLLAPETGRYYALLKEYGIEREAVDFSAQHVLAVTDEQGRELDDIASEEDNERFLLACMEAAFDLTQQDDAVVYFSIAGGRKTMGACLSLAAQLYARPQDRVFHVLVSPEFESSRDFFFPPLVSRPAELIDERGHPIVKETKYASVTLVPLPFFPLRRRLADKLLKSPATPATLMLSLVREPATELLVDLAAKTVSWKGFQLDLPPVQMTLYAFFALAKKDAACERRACRECAECALSFEDVATRQEEITRLYQRVTAGGPKAATSDSGIVSLSKENFNSYRAKVNREINNRFGAQEAARLQIKAHGNRPGVCYLLPVDRQRIKVIY